MIVWMEKHISIPIWNHFWALLKESWIFIFSSLLCTHIDNIKDDQLWLGFLQFTVATGCGTTWSMRVMFKNFIFTKFAELLLRELCGTHWFMMRSKADELVCRTEIYFWPLPIDIPSNRDLHSTDILGRQRKLKVEIKTAKSFCSFLGNLVTFSAFDATTCKANNLQHIFDLNQWKPLQQV